MSGAGRMDPISLEVMRHGFAAVAEEMNANLVRSAYSPNIKERRDCSSALFDAEGEMVSQAESIPVHLGAMPFSVRAAIRHAGSFVAGDVLVLNDPYSGGAHLPDITFVSPVFNGERLIAFVANRAHHADVGGKEPGSVAGDAVEIYQEGLRIPVIRLWKAGELDRELLSLILLNVRTPDERWGDLRAQYAACQTGMERLLAVVERRGVDRVLRGMAAVLDYSERRMRTEMQRIPDGEATFEDVLDDDGIESRPIRLAVTVAVRGDEVVVDFRAADRQAAGPINAVQAVTASATYFAVRALTDPDIPANAGCYRPIRLVTRPGTVVDAVAPAPVVGGNLETAQRIVDVVVGAWSKIVPKRAIAACQGTMNNVAIGGTDPRTGRAYTLYETIGGGYGASSSGDGEDGIHSHMTNTLNTPIEAVETAYPLRIERYELIRGSGGDGEHRGGMGIRRDIRVLGHDARVSLLTDRRRNAPYGVNGGRPGRTGRNVLLRVGGEGVLPAKTSMTVRAGEAISIETPGGGGYGSVDRRAQEAVERDRREGRV